MSNNEAKNLREAENRIKVAIHSKLDVIERIELKEKICKEFGLSKQDFKEIWKVKEREYLENKKEEEELTKNNQIKERLTSTKSNLQLIHINLKDVTSTTPDLIEIILAAALSVRVSKVNNLPLIWIFIVDVPSGDKTTQMMFLAHLPIGEFRDDVTSGSFASGYVDPQTGKGLDKEFLQILNNKVLVIKDLSAQFSKRSEKVKEFIGLLTNIYDGSYNKQTGTRGKLGADECRFSMIAGITDITLDSHNRYIAALGPRFFMFRQEPLTEEQEQRGYEILADSSVGRKKDEMSWLCSAYLHRLTNQSDKSFKMNIDRETDRYLRKLTKLQSSLRGYCKEENDKEEVY